MNHYMADHRDEVVEEVIKQCIQEGMEALRPLCKGDDRIEVSSEKENGYLLKVVSSKEEKENVPLVNMKTDVVASISQNSDMVDSGSQNSNVLDSSEGNKKILEKEEKSHDNVNIIK